MTARLHGGKPTLSMPACPRARPREVGFSAADSGEYHQTMVLVALGFTRKARIKICVQVSKNALQWRPACCVSLAQDLLKRLDLIPVIPQVRWVQREHCACEFQPLFEQVESCRDIFAPLSLFVLDAWRSASGGSIRLRELEESIVVHHVAHFPQGLRRSDPLNLLDDQLPFFQYSTLLRLRQRIQLGVPAVNGRTGRGRSTELKLRSDCDPRHRRTGSRRMARLGRRQPPKEKTPSPRNSRRACPTTRAWTSQMCGPLRGAGVWCG